MRTTTRVHTPEERRQMRQQGDRLARVCQIQLLCIASVLRTVIAEVIPLCGSAGWWIVPVCLLPGLAVYALLAWVIRKAHAATLTEAVRMLWGKAGVAAVSVWLALLLLLDGVASMTALVTSFTEGIGTEGTQATMAALTLGALLLCIHRDGLPWGVWLMRRALMLLAAVIAGVMLGMARLDGVHPVMGQGTAAVWAAVKSGVSMGWPLVLLLTAEPAKPGRGRPVLLPVFSCTAMGLLICLTYPCEILVRESNLAARLLLPVLHLPPALRTVAHSLGMLTLLLGMASDVQLASNQLLMPSGRELVWLPWLLAALLAASQLLSVGEMWQRVGMLLVFLPALLVPMAILLMLRRKPCANR